MSDQTNLPFTITCDDHETFPVLHWTGFEWSDDGKDALRFATREDADVELHAARDSFPDRRREWVSVEEVS
jgi:hypothetical protein